MKIKDKKMLIFDTIVKKNPHDFKTFSILLTYEIFTFRGVQH